MTPTKEKSPFSEIAIQQAASQLRAQAFAKYVGTSAAAIKVWVKRHVFEPMNARAQRQRQLDELTSMDDHMLRDLGLSRGGIAYAFENGREIEPANTNGPTHKAPRAA